MNKQSACPCGAQWYEANKGNVGITRYRKSKYGCDGGYSVTCTRCGRVGQRGRTQADAFSKWEAGLFRYGPLKEKV